MREQIKEEKRYLQDRLMERMNLDREFTDEEIREQIEEEILERSGQVYLSLKEKQQLKKELFNSLRRLDIISALLEDEEISEIMINGADSIFIEKKGRILPVPETFFSEERLRNVIQQIVSGCNRIVNETVPIVDARLGDGSRVNVVLPPVALNGPVMTIRKFPKAFFTMDRLVEMDSISQEAAEFLAMLVRARYNIFISGGTGSGKTTFLNVLSSFIPPEERVITIEDSAELQLQGLPNLVRMETRNANVEGENVITMSHLIKTALRMRPDRLIIGEVRDSAAMDMSQGFLSGHDGGLSTGHGNSPREMLLRLETMILMGYDMPVLAIRQQLASAIEIMVHLGRLRDNSRRVLEISEVLGVEDGVIALHPLYRFREEGEREGRIMGRLKREDGLVRREKAERLYGKERNV